MATAAQTSALTEGVYDVYCGTSSLAEMSLCSMITETPF